MSLPRMRIIKEAYAELKSLDPGTGVTEYYIRQLAKSGQVPQVRAGRKILINFDELLSYLSGSVSQPEEQSRVRPISYR